MHARVLRLIHTWACMPLEATSKETSMPTLRSRFLTLFLALTCLGGCGLVSYEQALQWHLDNEAMKKELDRQGFPQYSPPL